MLLSKLQILRDVPLKASVCVDADHLTFRNPDRTASSVTIDVPQRDVFRYIQVTKNDWAVGLRQLFETDNTLSLLHLLLKNSKVLEFVSVTEKTYFVYFERVTKVEQLADTESPAQTFEVSERHLGYSIVVAVSLPPAKDEGWLYANVGQLVNSGFTPDKEFNDRARILFNWQPVDKIPEKTAENSSVLVRVALPASYEQGFQTTLDRTHSEKLVAKFIMLLEQRKNYTDPREYFTVLQTYIQFAFSSRSHDSKLLKQDLTALFTYNKLYEEQQKLVSLILSYRKDNVLQMPSSAQEHWEPIAELNGFSPFVVDSSKQLQLYVEGKPSLVDVVRPTNVVLPLPPSFTGEFYKSSEGHVAVCELCHKIIMFDSESNTYKCDCGVYTDLLTTSAWVNGEHKTVNPSQIPATVLPSTSAKIAIVAKESDDTKQKLNAISNMLNSVDPQQLTLDSIKTVVSEKITYATKQGIGSVSLKATADENGDPISFAITHNNTNYEFYYFSKPKALQDFVATQPASFGFNAICPIITARAGDGALAPDVDELTGWLATIPTSAFKNVCFLVTKSRRDFYRVGSSAGQIAQLQQRLQDQRLAHLPFHAVNVFCIETNAFRDAVAKLGGSGGFIPDKDNLAKNWSRSRDSLLRQLSFAQKAAPVLAEKILNIQKADNSFRKILADVQVLQTNQQNHLAALVAHSLRYDVSIAPDVIQLLNDVPYYGEAVYSDTFIASALSII